MKRQTAIDSAAAAPAGLRRREWLAGALALLGGCGGGVDSGGTGTGATVTLSVGTLSGFGSIIVNGVRFDESAARIADDDGRMRSRDDLRLGMRTAVLASPITTQGGVPSAVASAVDIRSEVGGPIESIDPVAGQLVVLGQRVALHAGTVIEGGAGALRAGIVVWVYGTLDVANGRIVATRIEPRSNVEFFKVRGSVTALDTAAATLTIGSLRVSYGGLSPAPAAGLLAVGRTLHLRVATPSAGGLWPALFIEAGEPPLDDRDAVELEGRVTAFVSPSSFSIDGVPVDATGASFPGGTAGLVVGALVEAEGSLRGGVLVARTVQLEDEEDEDEQSVELHGAIESVDAPRRQFVVRGVTVRWSDATRFDSSTAADIVVGRQVEVKGRPSDDGAVVEATLIHVER